MEYTKLCDICDFQGGSQPPKNEWSLEPKDGYIRMLQIRDFTQTERTTPEYVKITNSTKVCDSEDILIARYGASLGKILTGLSGAYNVAMMKTIPNTSVLSKRYLYYYLKSPVFQGFLLNVGSRAAQAGFNKEDLQKLMIPKISQEEQRNVVRILESTEHILSSRQQELMKLDDLIKARFVEMFGDLADPACKWEKCRLVDACSNSDDIKCGPFGTQLGKDEYTEEGVSVWEIPQINSEFKTLPTHFVTEEKAAALNAYSIIPGDIAMSRKGNVGRCAVFPATFENGIIHSDVLRIRLDKAKVLPEFMMRQLHYSGDIQHQIELVSSGAIMAGINVTKLKQIYVYLPPIDLQGKFVEFIAQVDKSKCDTSNITSATQYQLAS